MASALRRLGEMPGGSVAGSGRQRALPEPVEHSADEGRGVTMEELLMLFKDEQAARRPCPQPVFSSGIAPLARLQDGLRTRRFLFCQLQNLSCFARPATVLNPV